MKRLLFACLLAVCAVFALSACGGTTLDPSDIESTFKTELTKQGLDVTEVNCPDDEEVKVDATFDCTVTTPDGDYTLPLKFINDDGDVDLDGKLTPVK